MFVNPDLRGMLKGSGETLPTFYFVLLDSLGTIMALIGIRNPTSGCWFGLDWLSHWLLFPGLAHNQMNMIR